MTPTARMCSTAALCAVICVGAPVFLQFAAPTRGLRGAAGAAGATGATPTAPSFGSTVGILGTTMAVGAVAAVARASKVARRSHAVKIYDTCIGCTLCVRACPTDVLEMVPATVNAAKQVASSPRVEDCVGCKRCETACPTDFLSIRVYLQENEETQFGLGPG